MRQRRSWRLSRGDDWARRAAVGVPLDVGKMLCSGATGCTRAMWRGRASRPLLQRALNQTFWHLSEAADRLIAKGRTPVINAGGRLVVMPMIAKDADENWQASM